LSRGQETTAVLLAAGIGKRLGRGPKALLPFRGRTLVEVLADVLLDAGCREVVVVLGAEAARVLASTSLGADGEPRVNVVVNSAWETGMGGSFQIGLGAAASRDHVLVALVDQPGLTAESVHKLLAAHQPDRVTAAAYRDRSGSLRRGHPLLFDASLRGSAAATAFGDAGARGFLHAHPELINLVDCSAVGSGEDLDTSNQLHLLQ
jgi:nicotine blue oxidoreductase